MRRSIMSAAAALAVVGSMLVPAASHATGTFLVGAAARDISPTPAMIAGNNFYLGGYGFGSGSVGVGPARTALNDPSGTIEARLAVGVMGKNIDGSGTDVPNNPFAPWVRAFAIGDGTHTIVLTDLDNQGTFSALKPNPDNGALRPYGLDDIRAAAAAATPGLDARNIVISSDHSHAGQDMTGVWGFVPDEYLALVKEKAVEAISAAFNAMQPAILRQSSVTTPQDCGSNPPTRIFSNQFCGTAGQETVDSAVRVLRAFPASNPDAGPFAVLVNAAIHATVGGGGNRYVSSDWVSTLSNYVERETPGATAVTIVGDVGRTQPNDGGLGCGLDAGHPGLFANPISGQLEAFDRDPRTGDSCSMSQFARKVQAWVHNAIATETDVVGSTVASQELFIRDPSHSGLLFGLNYAGDPAGAPIARSYFPPYLTGGVIGTWVGAYRVGDLLLLSAPGEAYPNIRDQLLASVDSPGAKTWIFGLANDQLGYLIAPFPEGYPEPIRKSFLGGDQHDPTTWGPDPIGNDNYFFNVSHTIGDHVMCTMVKGASALGFTAHDVPAKCALWTGELNESGPGDPTWKSPI